MCMLYSTSTQKTLSNTSNRVENNNKSSTGNPWIQKIHWIFHVWEIPDYGPTEMPGIRLILDPNGK